MNDFHVLKIERKPGNQIIDLLEENVIGTPGKSMVYKHHNVRAKVNSVSDPYFANLSIRNRLYGTICFSKREVYILGMAYKAFYLRYFTFRENFRTTNSQNHKRQTHGQIREDVVQLMNGKGLDSQGDLILYAYVDPGNIRSKRLIDEFGFQKISSFQVIPFSRLFPKQNKQVAIAEKSHQKEIKDKLDVIYSSEQLVSFDHLFKRGEYFIYKDNGKIVCGVQAIPDQWEILEMPGAGGKVLLTVLPKIPIIKRLFHPEYKFVFLESIFCSEGYEHLLSALFESALHHYKVNSGILCLDQMSNIYSMVKKNNLGLIHYLQGEKQIDIVVKTSNYKLLKNNFPVSVSGFDVL